MTTPFSQTLQALMADSLHRSRWVLAAVIMVLSVWFGWFLFAEVGIYQTAPSRLQAERAIHAVEASLAGRVVATHMTVGRNVRAGDVLVELEHTPIRLKIAEQRAQLAAARAQLHTIEAEISAEQHALATMQQAAPMAERETHLRYEQAEALAQLAEEELVRWRRLRERGLGASEIQLLERETTARQRRSEADEHKLAISRGQLDRRTAIADRQASIERLRRDAAEFTGQITALEELVQQIEHDAQNYVLRAPVDGPLADVAELRPGMMVRAGERLATILPGGELKLIADFPPETIGHIKPGQSASLRLNGFPAEQYGRVSAAVQRVAQEPRAGKIHVELAIPAQHRSIPLQHGLLGTVEIETDRVSPAVLILRAAGALLHHPVPEQQQ